MKWPAALLLLIFAAFPARAEECYPNEGQCLGTLMRDVRYGATEREVLDLYVPRAAAGARPLVVFVHGGAFTGGDKRRLWPGLIRALLADNYAVASVNYRLAPGVRYPEPMLDVARAVAFIDRRSGEFRVDARRIVLSGSSAGGGIALWLGLRDDRKPGSLAGVIAVNAQTTYDPAELAALFETRRMPAFLQRFFGVTEAQLFSDDPELRRTYRDASPSTHLTADDPAVVLIYTTTDQPLAPGAGPGAYLHHYQFGDFLRKRAEAAGADVRLKTLPGQRPGAEAFNRVFIDELNRMFGIPAEVAPRSSSSPSRGMARSPAVAA